MRIKRQRPQASDNPVQRGMAFGGRSMSAAYALKGWLPAAAWLAGGLSPALAEEAPRYVYGPHMWEGGWMWFLGPLWMVVFLAIIVGVVVLLVRGLSGPGGGMANAGGTKTALDILRERFARGEIDKNEFEERKRILGD
jgi:putative membrane protein